MLYQWACLLDPVSVGQSSTSCISGSVTPSGISGSVSPILYQWVCLFHPVPAGLSLPSCISGSVSPILYQCVCLPHPVSFGLSPTSCIEVGLSPTSFLKGRSVSHILYQWGTSTSQQQICSCIKHHCFKDYPFLLFFFSFFFRSFGGCGQCFLFTQPLFVILN